MIGIAVWSSIILLFAINRYRWNRLEKMQERYHKIHKEVYGNLLDNEDYVTYDKVSERDIKITKLIMNNSIRKLRYELKDYYKDFGEYSTTYKIETRNDKLNKILRW